MNKLYKCALGLLTTFILSFTCFSSAEGIQLDGIMGIWETPIPAGGSIQFGGTVGDFVCVSTNQSSCNNFTVELGSQSVSGNPNTKLLCVFSTVGERVKVYNNSSTTCNFFYSIRGTRTDFMSSLQCQTEYNLIPISEVTPNYCALNFGMIDPQECPINEGTGTIVRSNLMINDVPYAQNQNINVFIPDFLAWNISFNDLYTVIEVEGYNADEEYIENVINQEKLTPTNEDIEEMITGFMTNYFPYLALAIIFIYLARKIFKLFK